jgi:hypothetical protein
MFMVFVRRIKLNSGLIGKDAKIREKFHQEQLFDCQFPGVDAPHLLLVWAFTGRAG